ncbi:effector-associated constant component EACC1 [Micromonospora robiginosa]|uniref:Uncharacterized protein n=1 Tax=Micromonospora robiginosa TaxID=2749844 RepID=A0A7L6BDA5_9ACTN|nr:hypothetical protein [Micromonospora ferruginea]QLQ39775.1 hypothetical protein H1D33_13640 [Micromonospora ferruginea]
MDTVVLRLVTLDDDDDAAEEATHRLRRELQQLDGVRSVRPAESVTVAPDGARAGELAELGTLLAALAAHAGLVVGVLRAVGDWQRRRGRGRVEVRIGDDELVLDSATADEQRRLIEVFVDRVLPPER